MERFPIKRGLFDATIGLIQRSLGIRTFRHKLLSDNIANAENPNHIPTDVSFHKILAGAMEGASGLFLKTTHPQHLTGGIEGPPERTFSLDGVRLDHEMAKLAENQLMFQAGIQALLKKFESLKTVIQEGGK